MTDVTRLQSEVEHGDLQAAERLLPVVYDELRRLAEIRLAREPSGQTLQATELVHEAYLRLVGEADPGWSGRKHFFMAAAQAMRRILIDRARRRNRRRHGGGHRRVPISKLDLAGPSARRPASECGRESRRTRRGVGQGR